MRSYLRASLSAALILSSLVLLLSGAGGCGNTAAAPVLTLTPAGPTVVQKGETFGFSAELDGSPATSGVDFSVIGGDSNGTIDASGVYTPPATIPAAGSKVTIQAQFESQTATAVVDLRTSESISFGSALQVSDTAQPFALAEGEFAYGGVNDRLSVTLGSVHVASTWLGGTTSPSHYDAYFSHSEDFGAFASELIPTATLTSGDIIEAFPVAITSDADHNPGILMIEPDSGTSEVRLEFQRSLDGGATFEAPVPVAPGLDALGKYQIYAGLFRESSGKLHVVYDQQVGGGVDPYFTQSSDGGVTWSTAVPLVTDSNDQFYPNVTVDENSGRIYACWADTLGGSNTETVVATSTDGGTTFSAPVNISHTAGVSEAFCRMNVLPDGELYVLFSDNEGAAEIEFVKSSDQGVSFTSPKTVNSDTANKQGFGFLSVDSLGRIDAVWTSDTNGAGASEDLMWSRSTDGGDTFSPNVRIAGGVTTPKEAFILPMGLTHDLSGRLHVQFLTDKDDPGTSYQIYYMEAE